MALKSEARKRIFERSSIIIVIVFFTLASFFLMRYELQRSRDAQAFARVSEIKTALWLYAAHFGAYPSMGNTPLIVGEKGAECLSASGFVDIDSDACREKTFAFFTLLPGEREARIARYSSLSSDGSAFCTKPDGCPQYKIEFMLETNRIAPKGIHTIDSLQ